MLKVNKALFAGWCLLVSACGLDGAVSGLPDAGMSVDMSEPDIDRDGLPDPAIFTQYGWWNEPELNLALTDDWCKYWPGSAKNHGCPVSTSGTVCEVPGFFSSTTDWSGRPDTAFGYPFGSFCLPNNEDTLRPVNAADPRLTIQEVWRGGSLTSRHGVWQEMHEGDQLRPFALVVSSCNKLPGATITWRLKDGSIGKLPVANCISEDPACSADGVKNGQCAFLLPMDGPLESLTASDAGLHMTLYSPTIDQHRVKNNVTADGQLIPKGFFDQKECSGASCVF